MDKISTFSLKCRLGVHIWLFGFLEASHRKHRMAGMRAALALVAACVVACVVVVTLSGSNGPVALLEGKAHTAHKSPVMTALKETKAETLASAAQARLAKKDSRIFKSMALAAEKKDRETAVEDRKFLAARQTQIELDERLQQLTQRFEAQRKALACVPSPRPAACVPHPRAVLHACGSAPACIVWVQPPRGRAEGFDERRSGRRAAGGAAEGERRRRGRHRRCGADAPS